MVIEDTKQLALRFYEEALNARDLHVLDEILSPDFVDHLASREDTVGIEQFRQFLGMATEAFPDMRIRVEDVIAEGTKAAVRLTIMGSHEGVFLGHIQPTGKQAEWTGIDILEMSEGKIVARWSERDLFGLVNQLGGS